MILAFAIFGVISFVCGVAACWLIARPKRTVAHYVSSLDRAEFKQLELPAIKRRQKIEVVR